MSDVGAPAAAGTEAETTLVQQDGAIPETVIPAEPIVEAEPEAEVPAEPLAAEPEKPKRPKPWFLNEIEGLRREKRETKTQIEQLRAELAAAKPQEDTEPAPGFKPEQFEQLIDQRAQALLARREFENRAKSWIDAGNKEFGAADFQEKCAEVAAMGAGDSNEFMSLITDPDIIPDGHKVIAAMIEHPDEAQRILALEPLKMAAALTRFATTTKPAEKAISKAPAPIKPIGGTAKNSAPSDNEPIGDWMAKRRAEVAAKGKH